MQIFTGRGKRAALLDVEEPGDSYPLETLDIPHSILEDTTGEETKQAGRNESFLRAGERVPARRRSRSRFAWKNRWMQLAAGMAVLAALGILYAVVWEMETVLWHSPHFVLTSSKNVQITGNRVVSPGQVIAVFAPDTERSIFRIPLARRQRELQSIDWVRSATVMRLWPNRLRITLVERTPIAFARDGNLIRLVDENGVLLDLPKSAPQRYIFPVISGISNSDPASTRAARMQLYRQFIDALDVNGDHISALVSEVDLSDPEDLRAVFTGSARNPEVHFGDTDFLARYRAYQSHLAEWLQEYPQLRSVDMRYGKQIVLDTGTQSSSSSDAKSALTSGGPVAAGGFPANAGPKPKPGSAAKPGSWPANVPAAKKAGSHPLHPATQRGKSRHKHPQRGHTVHDPIAHVISGA